MNTKFFGKSLLTFLLIYCFSCSKESSNLNDINTTNENEKEEQVVSYDVNISSSEGGTVNTSSGSYSEGTVLNIQANPNEGYVFLAWEGFESTNPSITINVNKDFALNAIFIIEEEVSLDQNKFTDNVKVANGNVFQGAIIPNSTMSFKVENSENLIAVVDNGFKLDLSVPDNIIGALVQFKNVDGDLADSYIQIDRFFTNSSKSLRKSKNSKSNYGIRKDLRSNVFSKNNTSQFSFEIDFNEEITAGQICFNVHIYDNNNNISAGIETCVTINNFGGGPSEIHGVWQYYQDGILGESLAGYYVDEEPAGYYVGTNYIQINNCFSPSCMLEVCYDNGDFQGYAKVSNVQRRDYIVLNSDGSYEDRYETIINESPEIVGNIDLCLEDEYQGDDFKFAKNPYQTTVTDVYYGKWSYDETTRTIGIFDYSDQVIDSGGTIFDTPLYIYDEPEAYFDNGTFVEINGDTMTFKERDSYDNAVYVTVFKKIQ